MIHRLSSPIRVDVILNHNCNHKCMHCYNPWRADNIKTEKESFTEIKAKIDKIAEELENANVWSAILTGGEPLMKPPVLYYAIKKLAEFDISMSINSNLTLMTDEIARTLSKRYKWNNIILTSLPSIDSICCDEITQVTGSFERIIKGIEICRRHGLRVGVNTVITKKNISDLDSYYAFIKTNDIEYVSISTVIPPIYDPMNTEYYLEDCDIIKIANTLIEIKNKLNIDIGSVTPLPLCILKDTNKYMPVLDTTCMAGISKCSIEIDSGRVFACAHEENDYGNIYEEGLAACWDKMRSWGDGKYLNSECYECKWLFLCGGECRMQRLGNRRSPRYTLNKDAEIVFCANSHQQRISWPKETEKLVISKNLKIREEEFGVIIRTGYIETHMSKQLYLLCMKLKNKDYFSIKILREMIDDFTRTKPIINVLLQRGIIIRGEKNE